MKPWPDVIGARNSEGHICTGSKPSRSKRCKTRLVFHNPNWKPGKDFETYIVLACDVIWSVDARTCALLLIALMELVNDKLAMPFERGPVVSQVLGANLYIYEAGLRGAIFPRFWWQLPYCVDHAESIAMAIHMEASSEKLVAFRDPRMSREIQGAPPELSFDQKPRFLNDWSEYIVDLLYLKECDGL